MTTEKKSEKRIAFEAEANRLVTKFNNESFESFNESEAKNLFKLARRMASNVDLAKDNLAKFETGIEQILFFTGEFKTIDFEKGGEKKCPIFYDEDLQRLTCSDAILIRAFAKLRKGFYRVTMTADIGESGKDYRTFEINPCIINTTEEVVESHEKTESKEDDLPF